MRGRRLYHLALRTWMGQCLLLGFTSYFYSWKRKCLVHSRWLQGYQWFLMAATLVLYYSYWKYTNVYFEKGTFRRQDFIMQVSMGSVILNLCTLVTQCVLTVFYERQVCEVYNELARILRNDLKQKEPTASFYYIVFFAKFHNYLHNFNFALSVLMIFGMRTIRWADILANFYFVYNCLSRDSVIFCYVLLLLDFGEAMRLNSQQVQDTYGGVTRQLRRQERLKVMLRQVHKIFGWHIAVTMVFRLYFNMAVIYLGYSFMSNQTPGAMGQGLSHIKVLFSAIAFVVMLSDGLILQITCEYLLKQGNKLCTTPKVKEQDRQDFVAAQRQWEMSVLRRAILWVKPENQVLGMFRMDMQCAFALISSSLSYGIIIIQLGYLPSVNIHKRV